MDLTLSFSQFALHLLLEDIASAPNFVPFDSKEAMATVTVQREASFVLPKREEDWNTSARYLLEKSEIASERKDSLHVTQKEVPAKEIVVAQDRDALQLPVHQDVLLLFGPRQPYTLTSEWPVPSPQAPNELIVKIQAIGLNPFDWKSA